MANEETIMYPLHLYDDKVSPLSYSTVENEFTNYRSFNSCSDSYTQNDESRTTKAIQILRTHFTHRILDSLDWLIENHEDPTDSLPYLTPLFQAMYEYKMEYFEDPYSSFISVLYDVTTLNDNWINFDKVIFRKIRDLIVSLNNNKKLSYEHIEKATAKLESFGIDTTPF